METYPRRGAGRIAFYSVKRDEMTIGYVWATLNDQAMAYWKIVGRLEWGDAAKVSSAWNARIRECYASGFEVMDALEYLKDFPYDPLIGWIDPTEGRNERSGVEQFHEEITGRPLKPAREMSKQSFEDGAPMDRSEGWGPLSPMDPSKKTYKASSDSSITYLPVEKEGKVIGYLWASNRDWAAGFVWEVTPERIGFSASAAWHDWLSYCWQQGLEPVEALRAARDLSPDPARGEVVSGSEEKVIESLKELRRVT